MPQRHVKREGIAPLFLKLTSKIRSKFVPVHIMKACIDSRGITPLILNLGARWRGMV
jgi:hypothetical protein